MKVVSLIFLLAVTACGGVAQQGAREVSEGTWEIDCGSLGRCAEQAERICRNRGYDIIGGYDHSEVYGHEAGESQVAVRRSRLVVVCRAPNGESRLPPEGPVAAPPAPHHDAPPSEAPRALLCTPGATQRCVGKGACEGGQSCLPDGSGFGPCECADSAPASSAPAPTNAPEGEGSP